MALKSDDRTEEMSFIALILVGNSVSLAAHEYLPLFGCANSFLPASALGQYIE